MGHARIGRIRMKNGGADVRILRQVVNADGENLRGKMVSNARAIAADPADMAGYFVIGLFANGEYSIGFRLRKDHFIGATLLPSYVAEVLRREVLMPRVVDENVDYS